MQDLSAILCKYSFRKNSKGAKMAREIMNWANRGNVFYAEFNKPDVIIKQYEDTAKLTHVSIRINLKDSKISYGISGAIKQLDFSIPLNKDTEVIGK